MLRKGVGAFFFLLTLPGPGFSLPLSSLCSQIGSDLRASPLGSAVGQQPGALIEQVLERGSLPWEL